MYHTVEEIRTMNADQLEQERAEIRNHINDDGADIQAMNDLVDAIEARAAELRTAEENRRALAGRVAAGEIGTTVRQLGTSPEGRRYGADSAEYRTGFLRMMLGQELSREERSAVSYVATTGDSTNHTSYVLPTTMVNKIWDLIDEAHVILGDIDIYRTGTILEMPQRSAISQGDAATVNENAANDDEINAFAQVRLTGKDFSKHVNISYAMAKMSIDAFEAFLTKEIADRIGSALASDVVTQILTDYYSTGNAITSGSVGKIAFADVASTLAVLKNAVGRCTIYGSRATIYKYLVGMVDTTGRPIYQPNAQAGAEGTLVGFPVKVEDAITGDKLLIGYPKAVIGNMIQDIMIESDRDIKNHVITYAGYARFECKLGAPKAFATLTVATQG